MVILVAQIRQKSLQLVTI